MLKCNYLNVIASAWTNVDLFNSATFKTSAFLTTNQSPNRTIAWKTRKFLNEADIVASHNIA